MRYLYSCVLWAYNDCNSSLRQDLWSLTQNRHLEPTLRLLQCSIYIYIISQMAMQCYNSYSLQDGTCECHNNLTLMKKEDFLYLKYKLIVIAKHWFLSINCFIFKTWCKKLYIIFVTFNRGICQKNTSRKRGQDSYHGEWTQSLLIDWLFAVYIPLQNLYWYETSGTVTVCFLTHVFGSQGCNHHPSICRTNTVKYRMLYNVMHLLKQ